MLVYVATRSWLRHSFQKLANQNRVSSSEEGAIKRQELKRPISELEGCIKGHYRVNKE